MTDDTTRNRDNDPRPTGRTHRLTYDTASDVDLGLVIIETICTELEIDPTEMGGQLHEYVDVDALNRLFSDRANGEPRLGGRVAFRMGRYEIVIHSHGVIDVTELQFDATKD